MSEQILKLDSFSLDSGEVLRDIAFSYRTYGTYRVEETRTNAVLVFHALTGNTDCLDWWSGIIGHGKIIDPEKHFIICANFLGSCCGSSAVISMPRTSIVKSVATGFSNFR